MHTMFAGGRRESEGPKQTPWEPEPFELPLIMPVDHHPSRRAPEPADDEDAPEPKSRIIVIDLA